ncbi:uncharacterized protein LOC133890385 [Phragmites australis]|uniref:uncharacterized protein LOC133890385 n=1 Tax=Phragmites australis TaxID=29695 RepID=UPI002D78AB09|nr:uncharacterized protein LOC133890385 [Phragmites australis]
MSKEGSRASWNFTYEKGLADLLHEHNHEKFRGQNGWVTEGWRSIVKKFNEKFPSTGFTKSQIQEKEKELKGSYKAIRDARKQSGTGWNASMCMINAEPYIWDKFIVDFPKVRKFRTKTFPLYESLAQLYEVNLGAFIHYETGSIAIGDLNFTSTEPTEQQPPPPTEHVNLDDPNVGLNPFFANLDVQRASSDTMDDEVENTTSSYSGQKGDDHGKNRKQSQVAGVLQDYVNFRKKQTKKFMDELNETTKPKDDYSIKNCLALLESIEELSDEKKAMATSIFKCELNREIFINFKNPKVRLLWVKGEIAPKLRKLGRDPCVMEIFVFF